MATTNEKYLNGAGLVDLMSGLATIYLNRTCTEAQAIAYASAKPNTIYYTTDTHNIVVGGIVYGRSEQITANAFAYLPASEHDPSDPAFNDPTKIYIQPSSTAGVMKLWWYYNGQWINSDSQAMSVPISAGDITYDLTNTPELGDGDVQSAVEAVDDYLHYDVDLWEDMMANGSGTLTPNRRIGNNGAGTSATGTNHVVTFPASPGEQWKFYGAQGSGRWWAFYKGGTTYSACTAANMLSVNGQTGSGTVTAPANTTMFAVVVTVAGACNLQVHKYNEDKKVISDLNAAIADIRSMAVISAIGYDLSKYEYPFDEQGYLEAVHTRQRLTGVSITSLNSATYFKGDTSMIYLPYVDFSNVTNASYAFQGCKNLRYADDISLPKATTTGYMFDGCDTLNEAGNLDIPLCTAANQLFNGCSNVTKIGKINSPAVTNFTSVFYACYRLKRVESIDFKAVTTWANFTVAGLRYLLIRNLGVSSRTSYDFSGFTYWGVNGGGVADAKDSLIASLITYSADRSGGTACTLTLSTNTKNALTDDEKASITAKGYTIA